MDVAFGTGGKVLVDPNPVSGPNPLDMVRRLLLTPSGDVYAVGMADGTAGSRAIDIVALRADGSLQQEFGNAGVYTVDTGLPWQIWLAQGALLTHDGRIVVSGTHWPGSSPDAFVLWAYTTTPRLGQTGCP